MRFGMAGLVPHHSGPFQRACKSRAVSPGFSLLSELALPPRRAGQFLRQVRALPGQIEIRPAEMTVRGGLPIDRTTKLEVIDDRAGPEIVMLRDQLAHRFLLHPGR